MTSAPITVTALSLGKQGELGKVAVQSLQVELDGLVGDRHRGVSRTAWKGDKQAEGTIRRNERMWSAVSDEELGDISARMDLAVPLTAAEIGANICLSGISNLSQLPMGTVLTFPSGAELMVEEFNPPCLEMGEKLAASHKTKSGVPLKNSDFSKASKYLRGVVGVVEVAGVINVGDRVVVTPYAPPKWITSN